MRHVYYKNIYLNICRYMEDCGDNPFTQGEVCAKIMYQEFLTDEVNVDYLLVAVKQINDKIMANPKESTRPNPDFSDVLFVFPTLNIAIIPAAVAYNK